MFGCRLPKLESARHAWELVITSVVADDWNPKSKFTFVCSEHFLETDYIPSGVSFRLKNVKTVPTLNLPSRADKENDKQVIIKA